MPKYTEEDAYAAIEGNKDGDAFEKKYPDCVINIGNLSPKKTETWIGKNPISGDIPKIIWYVEYEELDKEKLILFINPNNNKVIGTEVEKLKPAPSEEE